MNTTLRALRTLPAQPFAPRVLLLRSFSSTTLKRSEGATGSIRPGGERSADSWSRREKAAEDLYIRGREKAIMQLLKEKIAKQEEALIKDRMMLSTMEDQYGRIAEERANV